MDGSVCLKFDLNLNISNLDECLSQGIVTVKKAKIHIFFFFFKEKCNGLRDLATSACTVITMVT